MTTILARSVMFVAVAGAALPAAAVELVTNGGFETGTFSGWTQFGGLGQTNVNVNDAVTGVYGARFSPNSVGGIEQTLATVAGTNYTISFDLRHFALPNTTLFPPANSFLAEFDGVVLTSLTNVANSPGGLNPLLPGQPWVSYSYTGVASSAATVLKFSFRDNRSGPRNRWSIDNISVTSLGRNIGGVPEPATWALLMLGFGLVGYAARRGRRALPAVAA